MRFFFRPSILSFVTLGLIVSACARSGGEGQKEPVTQPTSGSQRGGGNHSDHGQPEEADRSREQTTNPTPNRGTQTPVQPHVPNRGSGPSAETPPTQRTIVAKRYRVVLPAGIGPSGPARPLLVVIHGCAQSAEAMEKGTRMDEEAKRRNFIVLYPDQERGRHRYNCWRWFDPKNRQPYQGELGEIISMIDEVSAKYPVDRNQTFVAGLSSGAATAAGLLACHGDRFRGGALHSGPAFDVANSELSAMAVLRYGPPIFESWVSTSSCEPKNFKGRLLVIQGDDDQIVNPAHGPRLMAQFYPDRKTGEELGLKLASSHVPKTRVSCTKETSANNTGCLVKVDALEHAWAGGAEGEKYFDSKAFSASELIARFLIDGDEPFTRAVD